jgi:hypothetical protein
MTLDIDTIGSADNSGNFCRLICLSVWLLFQFADGVAHRLLSAITQRTALSAISLMTS